MATSKNATTGGTTVNLRAAAAVAALAAARGFSEQELSGLPPALQITAKRESYYAGGQNVPFTFEPRIVPITSFTKAQLEDLVQDPYVTVKPCDLPEEPDPDTPPAA